MNQEERFKEMAREHFNSDKKYAKKSCVRARAVVFAAVLIFLALASPFSGGPVYAQPTWQTVTIPGLPAGAKLHTVWASSPNDVYVTTATETNIPDTFVFHWNGISWNLVLSLPGHTVGGGGSVFGTGPSDVFVLVNECTSGLAVGCQLANGQFNGRIFRSTDGGGNWTPQILPETGAMGNMRGTAGNVHVITSSNIDGHFHIIRFNGSSWSIVYTATGNAVPYNLTFISENEGYFTTCWGWGKWNGISWTFNGIQFDFCDVSSLWGTRDSSGTLHLYTSGTNNFQNGVRVWKFNEVTSPCVPPGSPCSFGSKFGYVFADGNGFIVGGAYGMWGSGPNDIYVIGRVGPPRSHEGGRLYHFDGTSWQRVTAVEPIDAGRAIWGTGPHDVWMTTTNDKLLHFGEAMTRTCITPPSNMISWWPGDGNTDEIVGGRNGSIVGSAAFAPGMVSNAFSFDGNSWVEVPDDPIWTLGTNNFTIDLWVRFNSLRGRDPFIAHSDGPGAQNKWIFMYDASGHDKQRGVPALRFIIYSQQPGPVPFPHDPVVAPWNPLMGRWYHVAVTRSGNSYALYIDGVQVATDTSTFAIPDPSVPLTIGTAESPSSVTNLDGLVDEVEIFNRALSASEIQSIFNAGSAGKCKDLPPRPSPPTGVTAVAGDGQVTISWEDVAGATSYNLYMAAESGVTAANFGSLSEGMQHTGVSSPYTHTGLTNGTTYYFVVTAVNAAGESLGSAEVSATPTSVVDTDGDGIPDADDECPLLPTTNTITGTAGNDVLKGTSANDLIRGLEGDDTLKGYGGDDCLVGGPGNDKLKGYAGDDMLLGQDGDDDLRGGDGADSMDGGDGADRMTGGSGNDAMTGGAGNDRMSGRDGNDTMDGGEGADRMTGGVGNDAMTGGAGNDRMSGRDGDDTMDGGAGDDKLSGGADDDALDGGSDTDKCSGGSGTDTGVNCETTNSIP